MPAVLGTSDARLPEPYRQNVFQPDGCPRGLFHQLILMQLESAPPSASAFPTSCDHLDASQKIPRMGVGRFPLASLDRETDEV